MTNDYVGQYEINEEYDSEQMCFDVDTDEGVNDKVPKFVKYNVEDINKSFKELQIHIRDGILFFEGF